MEMQMDVGDWFLGYIAFLLTLIVLESGIRRGPLLLDTFIRVSYRVIPILLVGWLVVTLASYVIENRYDSRTP